MSDSIGQRKIRRYIKAGFLSATFTSGLFLLLPYVHLIVPAPPPMLTLIDVPRVSLPEPLPLPIPNVSELEPAESPVVFPELLAPVSPAVPLEPVLNFDFGLADIGGDFSMAFSVSTEPMIMNSGNVLELSEVDHVPQAVVQMRPFYPALARRRRTEGEVAVVFTVTTQGSTADPQILSSTPDDVFTEAALRAIERWRFVPAMKGGQAVAVRVRQVIRFKMED